MKNHSIDVIFDSSDQVFIARKGLGSVREVQIGRHAFVQKEFYQAKQDDYEQERNNHKLIRERPHRHLIFPIHENDLGRKLIFYPRADCDLEKYIESTTVKAPGHDASDRLLFLRRSIGCLISAVQHLHESLRMKHKDLKPPNILVMGDVIVVADFGISHSFNEQEDSASDGPTFGTRHYKAPEAVYAEKRTRKQDIWSLALTVLDMLHPWLGIRVDDWRNHLLPSAPWQAPEKVSIWLQILQDKAKASNEVWILKLLPILAKCLDIDPAKRPRICELVQMIEDACPECIGPCCSRQARESRQSAFDNSLRANGTSSARLNTARDNYLLRLLSYIESSQHPNTVSVAPTVRTTLPLENIQHMIFNYIQASSDGQSANTDINNIVSDLTLNWAKVIISSGQMTGLANQGSFIPRAIHMFPFVDSYYKLFAQLPAILMDPRLARDGVQLLLWIIF
jgi:serine/threonine protein kinase